MTSYIVRRLLLTIPVLFVVASVAFLIIRVLPGDLAELRLGEQATPDAVRELRKVLGLDRPLAVQYLEWLRDSLMGDFGSSETSGRPVARQFASAFPVTLELSLLSLGLAIVVGVPFGVVSAYRPGRPVDYGVRLLAALGQAVPSFWLAIVSLTLMSIYFHWTPPFQYRPLWEDPFHNLKQLLLPVLILSWVLASIIVRVVRSSMLEVLGNDFVRTARAKGLSEPVVLWRHTMRHTLMPVLTVIGVQLGTVVGGTVIIEQIFVLPGVGKLTLQSLLLRDYAQLQFNVLVLAAVVVLLNLVVDLSYVAVDPRIRGRGPAGTG